jgi:hypothetical protein
MGWTINKDIAPKTFKEFDKWYKLACHISGVSSEEAFKSIGGKVPKDVRKTPPAKEKK